MLRPQVVNMEIRKSTLPLLPQYMLLVYMLTAGKELEMYQLTSNEESPH